MSYDLAVIGGGPGGYVAAIRAAQLDRDVVVIDDQERPGGICLNWGCIPTKVLLHQAEEFEFMQSADKFGFEISGLNVNWEQLIKRSRKAAEQLGRGVEGLFKKNGVAYKQGEGRLVAPGEVTVGEETVEADKVLLATGAHPRTFPGIEPNQDRIITSKEAMVLSEKPDELVIMGAGAIGMEFAYFYHTFGTDVTVIEMMDHILPQEDEEISQELESIYEEDGMTLRTGSAVEQCEQDGGRVRVELQDGDVLEADAALVALGLEPNTEDLWAEELNIRTDDGGWIDVKEDYRTSLPDVYAIGDVIGAPWLAHVASHEGIKMVEGAFTDEPYEPMDYESIPACTYCQPQVASVGLTEGEARDRYDSITVGQFPFRASGRAVAVGETEGFVKLVFAGDYDELVGGHILGHNATEMIAELGLAKRLETTPSEIFETVHAHPTLSESVMEAALDAEDRVIHA